LDEKKIFYKGKPSFQKKKVTQQKSYLEIKKSSSYESNHSKTKLKCLYYKKNKSHMIKDCRTRIVNERKFQDKRNPRECYFSKETNDVFIVS
jgi:hypothetical protein